MMPGLSRIHRKKLRRCQKYHNRYLALTILTVPYPLDMALVPLTKHNFVSLGTTAKLKSLMKTYKPVYRVIKDEPYEITQQSAASFKFRKLIPPGSEYTVKLPSTCTCSSREIPCKHCKVALELFEAQNGKPTLSPRLRSV
jgi:hypothetical protein